MAVFRGPKSSTGEDQVEVSCHGSPAVVRRILALFEGAGFSPALPGEFSFRAFVNGKTDLVRAEAMNELVRSRSDAARADALARLEGGLSRRLATARSELLGLLAEVELRLDYGEDEAEGLPSLDRLSELRRGLADLAASYAAGRRVSDGLSVVLAGPPNAGKSRLFNLFLKEERSIVSPDPGTTRDWIEAEIELDGRRLRLIDTAGLRQASGSIEAEGVARSGRVIALSDILVYLVDASAGGPGSTGVPTAEDLDFLADHPGAICVWNKVDLSHVASPPSGFLPLSAATGAGFPGLAAALAAAASMLIDGEASGKADAVGDHNAAAWDRTGAMHERTGAMHERIGAMHERSGAMHERIASERQKLLLDRTVAAIDAALGDLASPAGLDVVALDLREAAESLGEMTGEISTPEILETIFSRFCVGK